MCKTCEILTCATCGKDFEYENRRGPKPKYCCFECRRTPYEQKKKVERRNAKRYCVVCTQEILTGAYKYCSEECADEGQKLLWGKRTCEQCGEKYLPNNPKSKYCSVKCQHDSMQTVPECTCKRCGKQFTPIKNDRTTYCSRECAFADRADRKATRKSHIFIVSVCSICGKHTDRPGNYCSDECRKESDNRKAYEYNKKLFEESVKPRKCKFCKKVFTPQYGYGTKVFCSETCQKGNARKSRRHNKSLNGRARHVIRKYYGKVFPIMYEPINAKKVLERDNWTCGICGQPIDKKAKFPHPQSKSIDHIVALAKGGSHTYDNVQAAHFICNSLKRDNNPEEAQAITPNLEAVHS